MIKEKLEKINMEISALSDIIIGTEEIIKANDISFLNVRTHGFLSYCAYPCKLFSYSVRLQLTSMFHVFLFKGTF